MTTEVAVMDHLDELVALDEFDGFGELADSPARNVLIAGEDFVRRGTWGRWLRRAGFFTATCPGPDVAPGCPRLAGDPSYRKA